MSSGGGMQKWAKGWSKTLNEQALMVQEKIQGKAPPIPDDPLHEQRRELNEYGMLCSSFLKSLATFSVLLDTVGGEASASQDVAKTAHFSEFAASQDLRDLTQSNSEAWTTISRHYDVTKGRVQQLQFELKNRISLIQQAQKEFENRDKKHKKMEDDRKKVEKLRDSSSANPQQLEKAIGKLEKATTEFASSTEEVSDQLNHLLAGRQRFLQDTMRSRMETQCEFFTKVSIALTDTVAAPSARSRRGPSPGSASADPYRQLTGTRVRLQSSSSGLGPSSSLGLSSHLTDDHRQPLDSSNLVNLI